MNRQNCKGFSLIELMVTVVIVGLLFTVGSSLSSGWFEKAHNKQAESLFLEGISRTRSVALRNPNGVNDENDDVMAAAALCLTNQTLSVQALSETHQSCTNDTDALIWSAQLPEQVIIKEENNSNRFFCLGMNNRGLIIADTLGNQSCNLQSELKSNDIYICPCAISDHNQHSSACNFTLNTEDSTCRKVELN